MMYLHRVDKVVYHQLQDSFAAESLAECMKSEHQLTLRVQRGQLYISEWCKIPQWWSFVVRQSEKQKKTATTKKENQTDKAGLML